jgi:hypothetical protein
MNLWSAKANFEKVIAGLTSIGYGHHNALLETDYAFVDYFTAKRLERRIAAAAFGQTPVSYESACIGVACANGVSGKSLVNEYRCLGAPVLLEVDADRVTEWLVSRNEDKHELVQEYPTDRISQLFTNRASYWKPEVLLRAKNIGSFQWVQQGNLFAGLLPELEEQIQESLDPLLRDALSVTKRTYRDETGRDPEPSHLFKLVFFLLTAKVFHDRRIEGFRFPPSQVDDLLELVASRYKTDTRSLLTKEARKVAASRIWTQMDFRNLSVEILSQIWSETLLDPETRRRLGIHRTSRSIVRYIIERVPFSHSGDDQRIVLEPCCGSSVFLVGAMNALKKSLFGLSGAERHRYFVQHLAGLEKDPFGVEISRLALTLADFPNPGGWDVEELDVFENMSMQPYLQRAGVVLCNPPFGDFETKAERDNKRYSIKKPVELLNRVLDDLHPSGVLGFVLPRNVVDGAGYSDIRRRIADRFANVHLTILPDRAFDVDVEVGLLIATEPIPHDVCRVAFSSVSDNKAAWHDFEIAHKVSPERIKSVMPAEAAESFGVSELQAVWDNLINHPTLEEVSSLARGIAWNLAMVEKGKETGNRKKLVRESPVAGFRAGVAPRTRFSIFETPEIRYLDVVPEHQATNSYLLQWEKPKAILNKSTRSRGRWRIASFADVEGLICYQTFIGVWPTRDLDEWILAAVLNGPVANAFVSDHEGKTDITIETLNRVPVPLMTQEQIVKVRSLIHEYRRILKMHENTKRDHDAERILLEIDSVILAGYHMPPRVERQLLDAFRGQTRPAPHRFSDYFPHDFDMYFSLADYISPDFKEGTAGELLKRLATV